jgi:hypothetical protein
LLDFEKVEIEKKYTQKRAKKYPQDRILRISDEKNNQI